MNLTLKISFEQIKEIIQQLPAEKKILLIKELEKKTLAQRFEKLLASLKTDELTMAEITAEVEKVRAKRYARRK